MKTKINLADCVGKIVEGAELDSSDVCFISFTDGTYIALLSTGFDDSHYIEEASEYLNVLRLNYRQTALSAKVVTSEEYEAYAKAEREQSEKNQREFEERQLQQLAQRLGKKVI